MCVSDLSTRKKVVDLLHRCATAKRNGEKFKYMTLRRELRLAIDQWIKELSNSKEDLSDSGQRDNCPLG